MDSSNSFAIVLALAVISWMALSASAPNIDTSVTMLHNAAWAGGLLIVGSGLLRFSPISAYAWLLIGSAILLFNAGVAIAGARPKTSGVGSTAFSKGKFLITHRAYRVLLLSFSIGFAAYLSTIARTFGLSTLISNPASIRGYSDVNYMQDFPLYGKILFYLGPVCLVLTVFPEFVQGLSDRSLASRWVTMAYLAGAQLATLQRTVLFVGITWAAGVLVLRLKRAGVDGRPGGLNSKRLASIFVAAIVGLVAFQGLALVLGKTGTENIEVSSAVDARLRGNPATGVLLYVSGGIPAFGKLVESQNDSWPPEFRGGPVYGDYNPQTWGAATFVAPLKLFPEAPHWSEVAPFTYLPVPTNVYTWLEPWYRDFRWVGVLFGSVVSGFIIGRFAKRRDDSPEALLAASLLVGFSALATFTNRFMTVMALVIYITIWVLGVVRRSRARKESGIDTGGAVRRRRAV